MPAKEAVRFRWSSLHHFVRRVRPACLDPITVLSESGQLADTRSGWKRYLAYLELLVEEQSQARNEKFVKLSRGWYVGSEIFRTKLRADLLRQRTELDRGRFEGLEPDAWRAEKEAMWEERLRVGQVVSGSTSGSCPSKNPPP
jgi:hypothetical protein